MLNPMRPVYRTLTPEEAARVEAIKAKAFELWELMAEEGIPADPRCMAVGRTKVEEAVMWATKALTA